MTRKPRPKRARRPDLPIPPAPLWKRLAAATAFTLGGGGFAWWGGYELISWIGALRSGQPGIETESVVLGLLPLGLGIGAIGPLFLLPEAKTPAIKRLQEHVAIGLLGLMAAALLLAFLGSFVVQAVMEAQGYRVCDVRPMRRVTFTDWAARGVPCPPAP